MADSNAIVLDVAGWLDPAAWAGATDGQRRRLLEHVAAAAVAAKRRELARGVGVDGAKLRAVEPTGRPDGATGPPLTPHRADSRSRRWLRATAGQGHVTLWWSHGWGKILGYHRAGSARLPVRDVIGLTAPDLARLKAEARRQWRLIVGAAAATPSRRAPAVVEAAADRFRARRPGDFRTPWRGA